MKVLKGLAFVLLFFLSACLPRLGDGLEGKSQMPTESFPPVVPSANLTSSGVSITPTLDPDEPPPARAESEFNTGFSKHSVQSSDILSGGPPKDGIPALKEPQFVSIAKADEWLKPAVCASAT